MDTRKLKLMLSSVDVDGWPRWSARERHDTGLNPIEKLGPGGFSTAVDSVERDPVDSAERMAHRPERTGERSLAALSFDGVDVFR